MGWGPLGGEENETVTDGPLTQGIGCCVEFFSYMYVGCSIVKLEGRAVEVDTTK